MPKVGDRVIIEGTKVGAQRREGSLVGLAGRLIKVRWIDGSESLITPGAGAVTYEPATRASGKRAVAAKKTASPAKTKSAKKAASPAKTTKKSAAKKAKKR